MTDREILLNFLNDPLGHENFDKFMGICGQEICYPYTHVARFWKEVTGFEIKDWFVQHLNEWEHFSGNLTYPVQHPEVNSPSFSFTEFDLWDGEYGKRRLELCKIMHDWLAENT